MPRYLVDVKAFIEVEVDAPDPEAARAAADRFVTALSPTADDLRLHAAEVLRSGQSTRILVGTGAFEVDGRSDVEIDFDE